MDWWVWVLIAVAILMLIVLLMELPSLRRYMRMKRM